MMPLFKYLAVAAIQIAAATVAPTAGVAAPDRPSGFRALVSSSGLAFEDPDGSKPQDDASRPSPPQPRRIALTIGNGTYERFHLQNAARDAKAVGEALRRAGFDSVRVVTNASRAEMLGELRRFEEEAKEAELAAIYYAGSGIGSENDTLLIPIGVDPEDRSARATKSIPLNTVRASLDGVGRFGLLLVDTFRNTRIAPDGGGSPRSSQDEAMQGSAKIVVSYASRPGKFPFEWSVLSPDHSPYAAALMRHVATPGLDLATLFRRVREDVTRETGGTQEPEVVSQLPLAELSFLRP